MQNLGYIVIFLNNPGAHTATAEAFFTVKGADDIKKQ
jgi:hypothetical protein